jgi:bifunctional DNA-binding transcriptional regulator/antitoxin component of YhaV-PrlF toxin-antitoxin module
MKIRPAWSGKKGRGGAIVTLSSDIRKESGLRVGDNVDIKVVNGKIIISKSTKEMMSGYEVLPE